MKTKIQIKISAELAERLPAQKGGIISEALRLYLEPDGWLRNCDEKGLFIQTINIDGWLYQNRFKLEPEFTDNMAYVELIKDGIHFRAIVEAVKDNSGQISEFRFVKNDSPGGINLEFNERNFLKLI